MSNYSEDNGTYTEGTPPTGGASYQEGPLSGATAHPGPPHHDTHQFQGAGGQQQWDGNQGYQGYQGNAGYQGNQGFFQGGNPMSGSRGRSQINVRRTFKATEFWVLVVVSIALLIAAAVTDQGSDAQSFGAHDAWKFVTWLAIAYIISRGLTKFAGHERDDQDDHGRR